MLRDLRDQLGSVEERLRGLRADKGRLARVFEAAKAAATENKTDATMAAVLAAKESVQQVEEQIEAASEKQVGLLKRLGDAEAGRGGWTLPGINGWDEAARTLQRGETRVSMGLDALITRPLAAVDWTPDTPGAVRLPTIPAAPLQKAADTRWLYPSFSRQPADSGDLSVSEYRIGFAQRAVSGSVERDPTATTEKAELGVDVALATEDLRQFAVVLPAVPNKLFEVADRALRALLQNEMQLQISIALDEHCMSQIQDAAPPSGMSGSGLIEQVRNAVAEARSLGANPTVLALPPDTAAQLDLTTTSGSGEFVFAVRDSGSSPPLWGLQVVESPAITDPMLIDVQKAAILYTATGTLTADPFTGLSTNTTRLRLEGDALLHVRDISGIYVLAT